MESKRVKTQEKIVFFLFLFIILWKSHGQEFDRLLLIKSSFNDPLRSLSNWNSSLSICNWNGVFCDSSSRVAKIDLSGKNISGKLPESIFYFPYIETIDLSNNQLSGGIPTNISSCFSLRNLNLSNNNLTGPLIFSRGTILTKLETLDLSNNMLNGEIPEGIGFYSGLKYLDLGGNVLVGKVPKSITNLTSLEVLTLASNELVGNIPPEISLMKNLKFIYLGYNNLSGGIPMEISELRSLNHLNLVANNLSGEIPSSLGNLTNLRYLFLYLNNLSGPIPESIFGLKELVSLDLSDNSLSGDIPELLIQLQNLEILHLFSNKFSGIIPNAVTSLPRLRVLQLWSNKFSGEIPRTLGKLGNLTIVDLSTNNLTGKIPDTLCSSNQLKKLILFSNSLQEEIPDSLSHCMSLARIRLQNNKLSGELSPEFTKLPLVYFLDLSGNNLSGLLNDRKWNMPELQMLSLAKNGFSGELPNSFGSKKLETLDLSENGFSGTIPATFGNFSELMQLTLRKNALFGRIPSELSSCKKLVSMDFSHNELSGQIPSSLSQLPVLGSLDLSMNKLSGKIPENLGEVESLVQVNVSYNNFQGKLPSTGAFLAINSSAIAGNSLCSGDNITGLPPCKRAKTRVWLFFMASILAALVVALFGAFIIIFMKQRNGMKVKRVESEDGSWELEFFNKKASRTLTIDDILSCTSNENVSYKRKSADNSMQFFVKKIDDLDSIPTTLLGKHQNQNMVNLIALCRSKKGGFLVYEYIEGKNLCEVVHEGASWERRGKIAMGIAKALRYLHCDCSPSVLVGDLSSGKVMVDGKGEARLRLNFTGVACMNFKCLISSAYVAPETRETKEITESSDIYAFGLILIELLTGKTLAVDQEFGVHENIIEWARYCYSDCHVDLWVDPAIKESLSNKSSQIVETMNLALQCTAGDPVARPSAKDLVKTLECVMMSSSWVLGFNFSSKV